MSSEFVVTIDIIDDDAPYKYIIPEDKVSKDDLLLLDYLQKDGNNTSDNPRFIELKWRTDDEDMDEEKTKFLPKLNRGKWRSFGIDTECLDSPILNVRRSYIMFQKDEYSDSPFSLHWDEKVYKVQDDE